MRHKHAFPIATAVIVALMVALSPWPAIADMPVTFLEVEPVAGASFGWGYNLATKQFTSPCLNYNRNATYKSGDPDQGSSFEFTESTSTIASKSNLSVSASLTVLAMGGTYKLDNKTDVAGGTESSTYSQSLLANAYRYNIPDFLDIAQVSFIPATRNLLTTPGGQGQFKQQCGDAFVIGIQTGREFIGTATVMKQNLKNWMNFTNSTGASASGLWGSASGNVNIGQSMEQAFGSTNIVVKTYSTGSNLPNPTKTSELQGYYQKFLNSTGAEKQVHLIVAPYKLVQNYPWENPLQGTTKEDYIGMMVVALWDLKAAIRDANFILDPTTVGMFALGYNANIKNQRVSYIKQLRDALQKEYDTLLKSAQKCDKDFTSACQTLAEFYDRDRNLAAQWHATLPERYLSDCYQPLVLKSVKDNLRNALAQRDFGYAVIGDSETKGNKCRVVAELTFAPDQSQLKANLSAMKMEWHAPYRAHLPITPQSKHLNDYSTWGLQAQAIVFDLDKPQQYGLGTENLKHCTWKGNGVQFSPITTPPTTSALYPFGFSQRTTHGYVDGLSGEDSRQQVYFGNGQGALEYITCEIDKKGRDDKTVCMDVGVRNVSLALLSKQDLEADQWKPGPTPQVPAALTNFDRGTAITATQTAQFKQVAQSLSASKKNVVNAAALTRSQATSKFKAKNYKLPSNQTNLIQMNLKSLPSKSNP